MASDSVSSTHPTSSMSFRLWHVFALMLAVAVWFTLVRFSPNLAIVLGVSVVPATVSLIIARRFRYQRVVALSVPKTCLLLLATSALLVCPLRSQYWSGRRACWIGQR